MLCVCSRCFYFTSLLSAITLYSTVFSTKMEEGVNQTEIARLLRKDGFANTGLTFLWYVSGVSDLSSISAALSCAVFVPP